LRSYSTFGIGLNIQSVSQSVLYKFEEVFGPHSKGVVLPGLLVYEPSGT